MKCKKNIKYDFPEQSVLILSWRQRKFRQNIKRISKMIFLSSVLNLSKEVAPKYQNIIKFDFSEQCVDPLKRSCSKISKYYQIWFFWTECWSSPECKRSCSKMHFLRWRPANHTCNRGLTSFLEFSSKFGNTRDEHFWRLWG